MDVPDSQLLASALVQQLITDRVTDLVLAPGSRSAPIAYAAWQARDQLRLHVRIDERSAGFLALGLAKASGRPVPVAVTSGTAAGNLLPAMMEAFHSRIPLVAITADRPSTMINTGANQTTDQIGLFGRHIRAEARLSAADRHPAAWRHAIDRALALAMASRGGVAGPAHLEVALTDPLVPVADVDGPEPRPMIQIDPPRTEIPRSVVECGSGTVVVAGDLPPSAGHQLAAEAATAGVPLLAEPTSNARHSTAAISTYRLLLGTPLGDDIRQVIMIGRPTLSRPVQRLLARPDVDLVVVDPSSEWIDPGANARLVVPAVALGHTDGQTLQRWQVADRAVIAALDGESAADRGQLSGRAVLDAVVNASSEGQLIIGSSSPIRDADLVAFPARSAALYANRGLAGIDGFVSTAEGISLADPDGGPSTWAVCGDLTFLHDTNGLLVGPDEPRPRALRFVVVNDDGGSIFATLEHGAPERSASFERLFGTAHHTDLGSLCAAHGISHHRVVDHDQLRAVLAAPVDGVEVVEAVVERSDRHGQSARWQALADEAVAATLRSSPPQ